MSSRQVLTLFVVSIPSVKTTIVPPDESPFFSSICKHYLLYSTELDLNHKAPNKMLEMHFTKFYSSVVNYKNLDFYQNFKSRYFEDDEKLKTTAVYCRAKK